MPPIKNLVRGFALAPLLPIALVFGVGGFFDYLSVRNADIIEAFAHALFVFVYFTIASYLILAVVAFPLYLLGWAVSRVTLFASLLCGAVIGGALPLVPFALQYAGRWPMWDSESLGSTALIVNGRFTNAGITNRLEGGLESAAFGAVIAFIFWFIAIKGNLVAQSRHLARSGTGNSHERESGG